MANKKSSPKKVADNKSTMIKIAEKVGEIAGKIVNEKNHIIAMAGDAIESMRTTVHDLTEKKKPAVKKATKKIVKKIAKKASVPAPTKIKKTVAVKKQAVKKGAKKAAKKTT
ncbi:hypothetical protein BH11BAC5_BH11BAC5_20410 [soil metagenome]